MADPEPIIPGVLRAMAVFESPSGLPRDRIVNTFHFAASANNVALSDFADVQTMVKDFYDHVQTSGKTVASYLSNSISRTTNLAKIKVYDLGESLPRTPHELPWTPPVKESGMTDLPDEVAVCLSYYAGKNTRRQRGRLFIGPLHNNSSQTTTPLSVNTTFTTTLVQAAQRLINGTVIVTSPKPAWAVLSKKDLVARIIDHGWVDNAFDTQRRRGFRSTSRTTF